VTGVIQDMTPFDVVAFLFLLAFFILGYVQGATRRIFGIIALLFSLVVAAQLRQPLGSYLAGEWTNAPPDYSYMVAFGALFLAVGIALSIGIQFLYHPAPLLPRYPVLDEILGGVLGVLEALILLIALLLVTDPFFLGTSGDHASVGEFGFFRQVHDFLNDSVIVDVLRHGVIPNILAVVGILFPDDVVSTFASVLRGLARLV
jgi:uncharacterized membrane protein required for colicin V production